MDNDFSHHGAEDELDDEIAVIRATIWDNCRDWCRKCGVSYPENEERRVIKRCRGCGAALGFLAKDGIDEYLKILEPEERASREEGTWLHLSGLVYKTFSRKAHVYDDFTPPKHWMKLEAVDPHDARATNWLFGMVSPEEIDIFGKTKHRIYWFDYLLATGSVEDIVRKVKANRALYGYEEPKFVILDKKYGEMTQMVTADNPDKRTWQSELHRAGINRIKLSHSAPGDVELGHKIVKEYLKPQYSILTQTARPGMLFAKEGCGGSSGPIHMMSSYQYDAKTQKASDKYKDFPDCLRYVALEQPSYHSPESEANVAIQLHDRMKEAIDRRQSIQG